MSKLQSRIIKLETKSNVKPLAVVADMDGNLYYLGNVITVDELEALRLTHEVALMRVVYDEEPLPQDDE